MRLAGTVESSESAPHARVEVARAAPAVATPGGSLRTTDALLGEELRYFGAPEGSPDTLARRADAAELSALCLSGGGIRSASFCLGALQALARHGELGKFHYLSTVSGGGFAGGWLQVLIRERGGVGAAVAALAAPDPTTLARLRNYTNYLTPETGPFSKDAWASVVLYLRNLILTWLVLLPILVFVPLLLLADRTGLEAAGTDLPWWVPMLVGSAALLFGTFNACILLPSHRPIVPRDGAPGTRIAYASPAVVAVRIVLPTCLWALCLPASLRAFFAPTLATHLGDLSVEYFAAWYLIVQFAAYGGAMVWQGRDTDPGYRGYDANKWVWLLASLVSAVLIDLGARVGLGLIEAAREPGLSAADAGVTQPIMVFAPLGFVIAHLLQSVVFMGLRRGARLADLDREWVARADGQILLAGVAWTLLCLCCLTLSEALPVTLLSPGATTWPAWVVSIAGILSGPTAAWLGQQVFARVQAVSAQRPSDALLLAALKAMAVAFAVTLFAVLTWGLVAAFAFLQIRLGQCEPGLIGSPAAAFKAGCHDIAAYEAAPLTLQLRTALGLALAVALFSVVNVNRFSMHAVYRNRLTRGFLGSARQERDGDPYTDFDEADSPRLAELRADGPDPSARRLLPVVNMTLNLTQVRRTDWAERKAAPFVATPFACGSAALDRPTPDDAAGPNRRTRPRGAYVRTQDYACKEFRRDARNAGRGPLLGGLMTISGAAVSPNWGYHSSPTVAFLMTLFNVRLGAWLPNPAVARLDDLALAKPRNSMVALLSDLGGRSSDTKQAVYLSDGGHFDNLGLYEMLRRRCARIVVIDAGQDEACTFSDLGGVIRKAAIDGLATVRMGEMRILARSAMERDGPPAAALGYASGTIRYENPGAEGTLTYIKPSFLAAIPAEVRAYGARNPAFPHESTTNQWFSESQFESYRALGAFQVDAVCEAQRAAAAGAAPSRAPAAAEGVPA